MSLTPPSRAAEALDALVRPPPRRRRLSRGGPRTDTARDEPERPAEAFSEFGLGAPAKRSDRRSGGSRGPRERREFGLPSRLPSVLARLDARVLVALGLVVVVAVGAIGYRALARPASLEESMPIATDATGGTVAPIASAADGSAVPGAVGAVSSTTVVGASTADATASAAAGAPVFVHVAGAVTSPGVVQLPGGSRVVDAVTAAGGLRPDADPDRVNLAAPLVDGSRIVVPAIGQEPPTEVAVEGATTVGGAGSTTGATSDTPTAATPVDLNTATLEQLDELPGVGPATAQAIISFRESDGRFTSVDALMDVRGIGEAKLEALRDLVTVG